MGSSYARGFADAAAEGTISRENALRCHLQCNFYPPPHPLLVMSTVAAFSDHWLDNQPIDETFADRCGLKDVAALIHYHGPFLNQEEG